MTLPLANSADYFGYQNGYPHFPGEPRSKKLSRWFGRSLSPSSPSRSARCRAFFSSSVTESTASAIAEAMLGKEQGEAMHPRPRPIQPARNLPAPPPSDRQTRKRMTRQGRRDTKPEILLRKKLTKRGLRYRVDCSPVEGIRSKADIVFPRLRLAIFVHGCFWHGCPEHARPTKSNTKWWAEKIAANRQRDMETSEKLSAAGWHVERIWEHEAPEEAADRIAALVAVLRSGEVVAA
jgi:DNA mismatch endonuclease (patch repair protein)